MAFMLALVFIFEIVNREVELITKPQEGIIGAQPDVENGAVAAPQGSSRVTQPEEGHSVTLPPEVGENGQPLSEVYAEVTGTLAMIIACHRGRVRPLQSPSIVSGMHVFEQQQGALSLHLNVGGIAAEDHDAPKTVEEKIQHRHKVLLMQQFSWAAAVCVACYVVALVLPLFYYSQPGEEDTAVLVVLILWNCVRWIFLAGLCYIFRFV